MATIPESEPACAMFACGFCAHAKEKKMHIQKNVTRGSYTKKCTSPCVYKIFDIQVCIQKKLTHLRVYKTKVKFQIFFSKMFASIQKSCTPPGVYKKQHRCFSIQKKVTPYTKKCHEISLDTISPKGCMLENIMLSVFQHAYYAYSRSPYVFGAMSVLVFAMM